MPANDADSGNEVLTLLRDFLNQRKTTSDLLEARIDHLTAAVGRIEVKVDGNTKELATVHDLVHGHAKLFEDNERWKAETEGRVEEWLQMGRADLERFGKSNREMFSMFQTSQDHQNDDFDEHWLMMTKRLDSVHQADAQVKTTQIDYKKTVVGGVLVLLGLIVTSIVAPSLQALLARLLSGGP